MIWHFLISFFLHGTEYRSRLNLMRSKYLCHQPLNSHERQRHNFSLTTLVQYQADKWLDKEKYQSEYYQLIQPQILQTNITRIVRETVRRITNKFRKMRLFGKFLVALLLLSLTPYVSLVSGVYSSTKSVFFCNSSSRS